MDITQLLITVGAVAGIIIIGLLAVVPSLLDYPRGHDRNEPSLPTPTPIKPIRRRRHRRHRNPDDHDDHDTHNGHDNHPDPMKVAA
jgi:hypothetical protein